MSANDSKFTVIFSFISQQNLTSLYHLAAGVPVKLLFQGEGHIVTVELKNGEVYRGQLVAAEDTMNCQLKEGNFLCFC